MADNNNNEAPPRAEPARDDPATGDGGGAAARGDGAAPPQVLLGQDELVALLSRAAATGAAEALKALAPALGGAGGSPPPAPAAPPKQEAGVPAELLSTRAVSMAKRGTLLARFINTGLAPFRLLPLDSPYVDMLRARHRDNPSPATENALLEAVYTGSAAETLSALRADHEGLRASLGSLASSLSSGDDAGALEELEGAMRRAARGGATLKSLEVALHTRFDTITAVDKTTPTAIALRAAVLKKHAYGAEYGAGERDEMLESFRNDVDEQARKSLGRAEAANLYPASAERQHKPRPQPRTPPPGAGAAAGNRGAGGTPGGGRGGAASPGTGAPRHRDG